jgi:hypothetical protein
MRGMKLGLRQSLCKYRYSLNLEKVSLDSIYSSSNNCCEFLRGNSYPGKVFQCEYFAQEWQESRPDTPDLSNKPDKSVHDFENNNCLTLRSFSIIICDVGGDNRSVRNAENGLTDQTDNGLKFSTVSNGSTEINHLIGRGNVRNSSARSKSFHI